MHLLLFHEAADTDSIVDNNAGRGDSDTVVAPTPAAKQPRTELSSASKHGVGSSLRPVDEGGREKQETQGSRNPLGLRGSGGGGGRGADTKSVSGGSERRTTAAMAGKNGRFATAGRVRDFRMVLKGVAAHASKMKVCSSVCKGVAWCAGYAAACFFQTQGIFDYLRRELARNDRVESCEEWSTVILCYYFLSRGRYAPMPGSCGRHGCHSRRRAFDHTTLLLWRVFR